MPSVMQWPPDPDARHAQIATCAAALEAGQLVVLPTETVYAAVADARNVAAVERLAALDLKVSGEPMCVAVPAAADAAGWLPADCTVGRRLARRCWPGPLYLSVPGATGAPVWLTCPEHEVAWSVATASGRPCAFAELFTPGGDPVTGVEAVPAEVSGAAAAVVDAGPTTYGRLATVVAVCGEDWRVERAGVVPEDVVARLSARLVLFVCTGNTCRSPMAEAICKAVLAARLGCAVAELPARGFMVYSAGLAALRGEPSSPEAVAAALEHGADLGGHTSRPLTADVVREADVLIGMTANHLGALHGVGGLATEPRLLGGDTGDLADPVGGPLEVYRECANAIRGYVEVLVDELLQAGGRGCASDPGPPASPGREAGGGGVGL